MFKVLLIMKKYKKIIVRKGVSKMTKKDFIRIATCLGSFKHYLLNDNEDIDFEYQNLIDSLKITCMKSNNNFRGDLFDHKILHSLNSPQSLTKIIQGISKLNLFES
jgi:hypothetical protein